MRKRKIAIVTGAALVGLAGLWLMIGRHSPGDGASSFQSTQRGLTAPVAVEIAAAERGFIEERRTFTGTLRPEARFDLSTQIAGRVHILQADLGDRVERGQVVARLEDDKYRFELEQARAELEVARANLAEAESALETRRREFERVKRLREQRVASESELDAAQAEFQAQQARVRVTAAQVTQREAALMGAELMLSYTIIRADWQGDDPYRVIAERFIDEGTYLAANTPVFSIVRLDRLTAVAYATERDYPRLAIGQEVSVTADAVRGRRFAGHLSRLAPVVQEASRHARMEIEVPNPGLVLKPGMFVRLEIQLDHSDDALIVPRSALIERPDRRGLYVADTENRIARYVEVETGLQARDYVEIRSPDLSGYVITLGQHLLSDGSPIFLPDIKDGPESSGTGGPPR